MNQNEVENSIRSYILSFVASLPFILLIYRISVIDFHQILTSINIYNIEAQNLIEAQIGLNLPYYALNFIKCRDIKSEVTCEQIVHAWKIVHRWETRQIILNRTLNDTNVIHVSPRCGASNQMFHIISGGVLSIVLNRSYFSESTLKGFEVPVPPLKMMNACTNPIKHRYLMNDHLWRTKSFSQMLHNKDSHYYITYTLHTRYFYIPGVSDFIFNNFGFHMIYFLGNYFIRLNKRIFCHVRQRLLLIPGHITIWGVHLRYERGNRAFVKNIDKCFDVIVPFLEAKKAKSPSVLFIASDEPSIRRKFIAVFNDTAHALNPLLDTNPGMNDFILLMNCRKLLLTFRSTFSFLASALTQRNAFWFNNEYPQIMKFSNSQIGIGFILREQYGYAKLVNAECVLTPGNEHLIRKYLNNLVL